MIKFRIRQPGQPDAFVTVEGDEAVVGRSADCEVVLRQPYVSKRHLKVLAGLVAVDLGSSNGTYVDGQRLREATLLSGGRLSLGRQADDVELEIEHEAEIDRTDPHLIRVRAELDEERRRSAALAGELADLERVSRAAPPDQLDELRRDKADLQRRLDALRRELEGREIEGSEGVQARLAADELARVQAQNARLSARVGELEANVATPELEAARRALAERVGELEGDRAELEETLRRARAELAEHERRAAEPALPPSELFVRLQQENAQLRRRLEESDRPAEGAAAAAPASAELFFGLQKENRELRARVAELEACGASDAPAPASRGRLEELAREKHSLELVRADLAAEVERLRARLERATAHGAEAGRPAPSGELAGVSTAAQLLELAHEDVEGRAPLLEGAVEDFATLEMFRFVRQVERVVTRMAGSFIQLYQLDTMLPDVGGNLRALLEGALRAPAEVEPRRELVEYLEELRRWLVISLAAHRRAAARFAAELKTGLSERGLTAGEPIPRYKRLSGQVEAELWKRVSAELERLTPDVVDDRLESLAREVAQKMIEEEAV